MINFASAHKMTSPNPFCLITSCTNPEETNIAALSWWTFVSNNPPTVAIALSNKSHSRQLISLSKEFGLCVVGKELAESALKCGKLSGREVNKATEFNIQLEKSELISSKIVFNSRVAFECKVLNEITVSDHTLFIAEVVNIHLKPELKQLYAIDGYKGLSTVELGMPID